MLGHGHHDHDDDDESSTPSLEDIPPELHNLPHDHPLAHHNPFRDVNDPDEADISNLQFRQLGPGRFAVTGTMYRTVSPTRSGAGNPGAGHPLMGSFASMLNSIVGGAGRPRPPEPTQGDPPPQAQEPPEGATLGSGSGATPAGHRFTYTSSARLAPRDPNSPGPHIEPVDELNNVLIGLMAAFSEPPGGPHNHNPHTHGPHVHGPGGDPQMAFNPLVALLAQMMPGNAAAGDFVYSQEALDRIISQLMDQNASGNAPGPATPEAINALPRKHVTAEMIGPEGHAECSICMEEVFIEEEVTELPCHHWFHHQCVAMWLGEHDTCPHCRMGITKTNEDSANSNNGGASAANASASANANAGNPQMPGAFGAANEAGREHPFNVSASADHSQDQGRHERPNSDESHAGGGFGDRIRRGLFGPPR
ncbi:hypothetical protein BCR34DRAFT_20515 [Clohesyomyces aquaticus]|uniref:RING-type E3 ubiquitin transferase n=1 Tax=Clohesyomyces aquaticus TaxID=1231657 RepID=A0A1Y1ZC71_9PLEO|nr:hypothetical protein BCR34DRAFT_20515 [Clohesyomyces aquaticus]